MADQSGQKPLHFVESDPPDGAIGVCPTLKKVTLVFDKNVVNDVVWENNRKQIKMYIGMDKIRVKVSRIKDTVDFSKRTNIYVRPLNMPFRPNTKYKVVIYPDLMSKNEQTLGKTKIIIFQTGSRT